MVSIPKIKLSSSRKREKVDLQTISQTTTNFGYVSPVWCREMMPNSKFTVSVGSKVYLQPMPKPTFGQVYMDIKHVFVPYRDICPQFDSFISSQPYTPAMGTSYVPQLLPYWNFGTIAQTIIARYADWTAYKIDSTDPTNPKYTRISAYNASSAELTEIKQVWSMINSPSALNIIWGAVPPTNPSALASREFMPSFGTALLRSLADDSEGVMLLGDYYVKADNSVSSTDSGFNFNNPSMIAKTPSDMFVSIEGADFLSTFNINGTADYLIAFKLKPFGKRLRNILLGLGYPFNPHSLLDFSPNKLLAFYKAWFALYRPQREYSFTMTNCYGLVKVLQDPSNVNLSSKSTYIQAFLLDLARDCYAYLPQDYFGMSVRIPGQNYQGSTDVLLSHSSSYVAPGVESLSTVNGRINISNTNQVQVSSPSTIAGSYASISPMALQVAEKVLRYVNKNTIVGRNIHDFIKAHFGVSIDDSHDLDSVYLIGSSNVPINISDIFSSTSTNDAYLGQYGGLGQGQQNANDKFYFENKDNFGIWLSMACVMPKSGYCQGYLRENRHLKKLEFFTPEFDAAGYQVLERGEISSDYPVSISTYSIRGNVELDKAFGFVPRYSEYKVSKNIVSGDLSLRSYRNNMSSYTLERLLPYESDKVSEIDSVKSIVPDAPKFVPNVVFDDFRRIDPTDTLGNYNRIFFEMDNKEDKFIVSQVFIVDAEIPAMSLSESFDTFDNDGKVVEIKHS